MDDALTPLMLVAPAVAFGVLILAVRVARRNRPRRAQRLLELVDGGDAATAEIRLRAALRQGPRNPDDRCAVLLDLAGMLKRRGDLAGALEHLAAAEAAPRPDPLDREIARFEEQLREV